MPYLPKVMLKTPLFTRFQPKKSDENLPKPQKYFLKKILVLKLKNWRKLIWSRIAFYNNWYVYLKSEVSWTKILQNIELPDFYFFLFLPSSMRNISHLIHLMIISERQKQQYLNFLNVTCISHSGKAYYIGWTISFSTRAWTGYSC